MITNYLNDFLFVARLLAICNRMIRNFLNLCDELGVSVSLDKTEWAEHRVIFLGILLDGVSFTVAIPLEKHDCAVRLLQTMLAKKKVTVKELQVLCGYLNFLAKAIFPGRTFI